MRGVARRLHGGVLGGVLGGGGGGGGGDSSGVAIRCVPREGSKSNGSVCPREYGDCCVAGHSYGLRRRGDDSARGGTARETDG